MVVLHNGVVCTGLGIPNFLDKFFNIRKILFDVF